MPLDPDFDPAPEEFRQLFAGQALSHLDEIVLSWQMGGHPIVWDAARATFQVWLESGPVPMFRLHAPSPGIPARIEVDPAEAARDGIPSDYIGKLWSELAFIGNATENVHAPITVPLGKFSRGDRKVFLAYALTIARTIARPPAEP